MTFQESPLFIEASELIKALGKPYRLYWTASVIANNKTIQATKVVNLSIDSNYFDKTYSVNKIKVIFSRSEFIYGIYPFKENLKIVLSSIPINKNVSNAIANTTDNVNSAKQTFIALLDTKDPELNKNLMRDLITSKEALDAAKPTIEVMFDIYEYNYWNLRLVTVGGVYRNMSLQAVLNTVYHSTSNNPDLNDSGDKIAVDVRALNNERVYEHVVIRHGIRLPQLGLYLQNIYGLYSGGVNTFFQNKCWYTYPTFDTGRVANDNNKVIIIIAPENQYPGLDGSYFKRAGVLHILTSGKITRFDTSNVEALNNGNGVRFPSADRIYNPVVVKGNKARYDRASNVTEIITSKLSVGVNNVRNGLRGSTANPFMEYSDLSAASGGGLRVNWTGSDPQLLTPGMSAVIKYLENDVVVELPAILTGVHTLHVLESTNLNSDKHVSVSELNFFTPNKL